MLSNADAGAFAEDHAMSGERDGAPDLGPIAEIFERDVLRPLMAAAAHSPAAARSMLAMIMGRLSKLEDLLEPWSEAADLARAEAPPVPPGHQRQAEPSAPDAGDIGRNQRAQMREMCLLEILAAEARPFSIAQLMRGLEAKGFEDRQPAVISQLHRMKNAQTIEQPGNGMYQITRDGLGHLQKLRSSVGALLRA